MRRLFVALVIALAGIGVYVGGVAVVAEVQAYRQMKAATASMFQFLAAEVGTRKDDDGKVVPVSRADVLALLVTEKLKAATAAPAGQ